MIRGMADMTLHGMVFQAAALHADNKAVYFDGCSSGTSASYTYAKVVHLAKKLAAYLQKHCCLQDCYGIGLYCYPGINLPSWILGILQVPAAYAPIDPETPPSLSAYFMKKCNLKYILVQNDMVEKFKNSFSPWFHCDTLCTETLSVTFFTVHWKEVDGNNMPVGPERPSAALKAKNDLTEHQAEGNTCGEYMDWKRPGCLAYILHTSGTTGIPKIVRVPHMCIVPNIQHFRSLFEITPQDVIFMASSLTFDPSVVELFVALTSGASLLIIPPVIKMMSAKLADVLFNRHRVTVLQATPTLLRQFGTGLMLSMVLSARTPLRILAIGGEPFPSMKMLKNWREETNRTQIFNLYGITEVSCWATYWRIPEDGFEKSLDFPVPLGLPLLGTSVEVRDPDGCLLDEGMGQVYIGGRQRVCFLDDEATVLLSTMRETGDWVELKNGQMYFIGRKGSQTKRHGKRLNLENIQQAAESLPQVEACAVAWYEQNKLILFAVVRNSTGSVGVDKEILQELHQLLPSHAIPDDIVMIESLPFTSHGKVDMSELTTVYQKYVKTKKSKCELNVKETLWGTLQNMWQIAQQIETTG